MMMAPATTSLVFYPGPLGLELEPVWEAGGRAIGCRVAGFKSSPDGSAGQAERTGAVRPGDVLTGVGDVPVGDMSFEKIVALLRHRTTRPERRLTFQSSLPATTTAPTPPPRSPRTRIQQQASLMFVVEGNDTNVASSGGRTEPATPSPEAQPRPVGVTNGEGVDHRPADRVGSRVEEQQQRLGWGRPEDEEDMMTAQSLKSAPEGAGMGEEDDGSAWWKGAQQVGLGQGSDDDNTAASDTLSGVEYFCPDGHAAAAMTDLATVDVGVSGSPENGQDSSSQGLAQVLYEAGLVPEACSQETIGMDVLAPAAASDSSAPEHVGDGGNAGQQCGNAAATHGVTGGPPMSGQVAGGEEHRLLPAHSTSAADARDPPVPACGHSQHQPVRHAPGVFSLAAIAPTSPGDVVVGPSSTVGRISTGLDGRRDHGAHGFYAGNGGRLPLNSSPETVDRSFDTVSLRSEPTVYAKEASSKQRISMLTSLWGGGRGDSGAASSPAPENGEGEVEEARRLARSLAVKLKERARRCEELEDLFGLRDHQVSMLQRQSNSLAARAASLADDLSDKSALIEALQLDRSRLERELALSRLRHEEGVDAARGDDGSGQRSVESGACGDESSLPRPEGSGAATAVAATPEVDGEAAVALAAAVEAAERKAAAAEARSLALAEMVDGLMAGKVGWEEERAARAAEALRLRALVRGLEEAAALAGEEGGGRKQVEGLRELLRERTRELEAKNVAMERLAVHTRELEEENRRLGVSLSAREEDILVSDKQMRALSARLKGEVRVSGEAAARAEAVVGELRKALEEATAAAAVAGGSGEADENVASPSGAAAGADGESGEGSTDRPSIGNRVEWAEERARLQHNLMSLREALEDRERQAEADEAAMSSRLKAARDDRDRSAREKGNLREAVDSLRVELTEALALAASSSGRRDGGVSLGGNGAPGALGVTSGCVAAAGGNNDCCGGEGVVGARPDRRRGESLQERESEGGDGETEGGGGHAVPVKMQKGEAEAEGPEHRRVDVVSGGAPAAVSGARDRWLDGGFEGTIDDVQLDLMEKDIVIEQLRTQLKQLRSRIAVMEEDQATDTAPLQELLNQLGELKGSVEEREEREQQCRDQVDLGLLRMERLKEESTAATAAATATAAVASPPVSFAGSPGAPQPISAQADPSCGQAQAELQRLRRQLEDLQWDTRTLKRRIEERDNQVRDARAEADSLKARSRTAERELGGAQGELAVAAAEVAAERRKTSALRSELQSSRAELQSVRDRAASAAAAAERSAEEQRSRLEQEGRDRLSAAAAAEARARDRVTELSASLGAATAERDALLLPAKAAGEEAALAAAAKQGFDPAVEDGTARAREVESLWCALAARDVELESIIDATAGFSHHTVGLGGSGALRGALAAATEARRAGRLVAELEEECSSLKAKVKEERAEAHRLREALEQVRLAEQRATAAATAATAAAATAAAARRPSPSPSQDTGGGKDREGGHSVAEAQAMSKRVQEAEDALQKALAGAQRAWGVVSSCLSDDDSSGVDDDDGAVSTATPPALPPAMASFLLWQQPASPVDPSLGALICGVEALAAAYRRRGHAARRATVAARAKAVCARETRRREEAEIRAREDAEGRLEEAMIALDDCQRCHEQHQQQQQQQTCWGVGRAADGPGPGGGMPGDGGGGRSFLSHEQEEHLRQIRSEVDRLEGQNQTLRRSLEGGSIRLIGKMTELYRETGGGNRGDLPAQRLLFPPSSATGGNNTEEGGPRANLRAGRWERADGLSGRGASGSTPSPSPGRSWTAPSNIHARGSPCYRRGGDGDGPGQDDQDDDQEEARARVLEEFADCCAAPQDDGSGGTLVPVWGSET